MASQVEARNFAIVRAGWNHAFLEELRDFPFGRKDDQVDALSRAFTMLTEAGRAGTSALRAVPGAIADATSTVQRPMFETICNLIPRDPHYPARARTLDILKRVLDGRLYDVLPYQFHEERGAGGEYIPLRNRRPSVRYALCRIVVEDSVSLLFSEGHFPTIDCADRTIRAALADIVKEARLNLTMTEAAMRGAIGSVAILMRVLRGRIFFDVLDTTYLTPEWDPRSPTR